MRKTIILALFLALVLLGCGKQEAMEQATGDVVLGDTEEAGCIDSDGGINSEVSGSVKGVLEDGSDFGFVDRCVGSILVEYYCEGNGYTSQNLRCGNKCSNGACS